MAEAARHPETHDFQPGIRVLARLARVAEQACQAAGMSLPQYRLLVSISGQPQRASELAARVGVSRPTLTSLVQGLGQAGLLRRVPVPNDRRGIQLVVTDSGGEALARADHSLTERMLQLIPPDAAETVRDVVEMLGDALDREGTQR